jgi:glycosyltransferase involved in cell wall biosynthesis
VNVAVVASGGVPNPTTGGGALTQWATIAHLVERGHAVTVYSISDPEFRDWTGTSTGERLRRIEALGARTVQLDERLPPLPRGSARDRVRRLAAPSDLELYPHLRHAEPLREAVAAGGHDVSWVYHFEALAASRGLRGVLPRYAAVGDPSHLPPLYHWRQRRSARGLPRLARLPALARAARRLLHECEGAGAFAAHHARQLGVEYLRTPVPDEAGSGWREERERHRAKPRPTILLVGHLAGAVTVDGLRVFAKVLPLLERALGPDGFEIRVVGGHEPPPDLRETFAHPSVRRVGHVEGVAEEFQAADAILVPTSIPLGIRVRVITAWSFGACVIAHRANALGTPELEHDRTALLGGSPVELTTQVLRALDDIDLRRRVEAGGRSAYERGFAPPVAAAVIERRLAALATA